MYAKLFSRITESSLIEESITTRWVFVAMLAIAEPDGTVIGTDIAIARRINVPLPDFLSSMKVLMTDDDNSNNQDHKGARIIPSEGERGYFLTGYQRYRGLKTEDDRRAYMAQYMAKKRASVNNVNNPVNSVNIPLAQLTHAEEEAEDTEEGTIINEMVTIWNSISGLPRVLNVTEKRKKAIRARMKDPLFASSWKIALEKIKISSFCMGKNDRNWIANLDFFLRPDTITKIMEGQYDDKSVSKPKIISQNGLEISSQPSWK